MSNFSSERLSKLEIYLSRQKRTQKEIAEHFGIDRKTVRRDIDKLSRYAQVSEQKEGRNTTYFLIEQDFNSSQFTPTEIAALILSQEAILAGGKVHHASPFAEAGKSQPWNR